MRNAASVIIDAHMRSCLPPGVPTSYDRFISARQTKAGRNATWTAEVVMFDGLKATLEVFRAGGGIMGHRWTDMPGGPCYHEHGQWRRECPGQLSFL